MISTHSRLFTEKDTLTLVDFIWGDETLGLRLDAKPETLWGLRLSPKRPEEAKK